MSKSVFVLLYALIAAADALTTFMLLRGEIPPALALSVYLHGDFPGTADAIWILLLVAAPILLVVLAYLRGRRIGNAALTLLPLAGILLINTGPLLMRVVSRGEWSASPYVTVAALALHVLCIWIGARPDALPHSSSRRTT